MLITQPILIRKKKLVLHKLIGKASYAVMPLLLISVLLILNAGLKAVPIEEITFTAILFPFILVPELKGFGFNLWAVYLIWIIVIAMLYPLCRRFDRHKMDHKEKWWLSYL
jgi:hypothetical protein